ncbi:hypothetical protein B0H66DRAFT_643822 [Apodospora peruviana]|uniref:RBR-type E3 ubiquitin transferase n=1 Tax=Apodospora peruviana TaxID=516989 RepID=A0AAE0LYS0_9PEZI|nr:hypothetical protein B0H66DRAFT_643822 [Apodospora peruviana]
MNPDSIDYEAAPSQATEISKTTGGEEEIRNSTYYHGRTASPAVLSATFNLPVPPEERISPCMRRLGYPARSFWRFLTPELVEEFEAKKIELSTPAPSRRYCHRPTCSAFIPPERICSSDGVATCPKCEATTCAICRGASHAGSPNCPTDSTAQGVLDLARANGWQRCPSCQTLVERTDGCDHMVCNCKATFC